MSYNWAEIPSPVSPTGICHYKGVAVGLGRSLTSSRHALWAVSPYFGVCPWASSLAAWSLSSCINTQIIQFPVELWKGLDDQASVKSIHSPALRRGADHLPPALSATSFLPAPHSLVSMGRIQAHFLDSGSLFSPEAKFFAPFSVNRHQIRATLPLLESLLSVLCCDVNAPLKKGIARVTRYR